MKGLDGSSPGNFDQGSTPSSGIPVWSCVSWSTATCNFFPSSCFPAANKVTCTDWRRCMGREGSGRGSTSWFENPLYPAPGWLEPGTRSINLLLLCCGFANLASRGFCCLCCLVPLPCPIDVYTYNYLLYSHTTCPRTRRLTWNTRRVDTDDGVISISEYYESLNTDEESLGAVRDGELWALSNYSCYITNSSAIFSVSWLTLCHAVGWIWNCIIIYSKYRLGRFKLKVIAYIGE